MMMMTTNKKILCVMLIAVLLCGCRNVHFAHKAHIERDTIRLVDVEHVLDSVYIDRWHDIHTQGDTTYIRDSVTLWRLRVESKTDTLYKVSEKTDTLIMTKTVKKNSQYHTFCGIAFPCLLLLCVLFFMFKMFCFFRKVS